MVSGDFLLGVSDVGSSPITSKLGYGFETSNQEDKLRCDQAVEESKKGNLCVMLLPVSTSTKIFHEVILPNASSIEFVRGRLHFEQKNEEGKFVSKGAGQHDSMVVVFQKKD